MVLHGIISPFQDAFVESRKLLGAILIIDELVDEKKDIRRSNFYFYFFS